MSKILIGEERDTNRVDEAFNKADNCKNNIFTIHCADERKVVGDMINKYGNKI